MRFLRSFQTLARLSNSLLLASPLKNKARSVAPGVMLGAALMAAAFPAADAHAQGLILDPTITTYAGNGSLTNTNSGNGAAATAAGLNNPEGIAYDSRGNTYIADYNNNTIRIVSSAGIINAFAGTGTACAAAAGAACGDGGAASAALFFHPTAMQFDTQGDLYIADYNANRVRKITATAGVITSASIVSTVAGTGAAGATGNGGLATAATLNGPHGLALDAAGDLWIANQSSCEIAYVPATAQTITIGGAATNLTAGHLYIVAGTGTCGGGGSGTVGTTTQLNGPTNVALDATNNLYIGDYVNGKVRKLVTTTGAISTIAGTASQACAVTAPTTGAAPAAKPVCGDGGVATAAALYGPTGVYVDGAGNIIIGDAFGARVREIFGANSTAGTPGTITTIAGTSQQCTNITQNTTFTDGATNAGATPPTYGFENLNFPNCGDGGPATLALVSFPILISVNPQGNILYVDQYDNKVREINENIIFPPTNVGTTSATQNLDVLTIGTGTTTISGVSSSSPQFVVNATTGCTLGAATATGTVCTTPIAFKPQYPGIQTAVIKFATNAGVFSYGVVGTGVAPQAVTAPGLLSTVAGTGVAGLTNGTATASTLSAPIGSVAFDSVGDYYIADSGNNVVREVSAIGAITTFAGTGTAGYTGDGQQAINATLKAPTGVAVDAAGNVYISDSGNNVVRQVSTTGVITTFVTGLTTPGGLVVDPITQVLFIADTGSNAVRQYSTATRTLTTVVGTGTACTPTTAACGDNGPALTANLNKPAGVAFDVSGNLYIADSGDNRIREVTTSNGTITTVVGTGAAGFTGNGGAALSGTLNNPSSLVLDASGDIYISDQGNNVIRFVSGSTTNISTLVGNGTACTTTPSPACGDGGPANVSALSAPRGVALDNLGDVYITETASNRIREAASTGTSLNFGTTPGGSTAGPLTALLENIGNAALTLAVPTAGNNPSISAGFTDGNTATCPQQTTTSASGTLAAGAQCTYLVSFTPPAPATYSGSLIETDNSLFATGSTQTVTLKGISTPAVVTSTLTAQPTATTYGSPVVLTETIAPINGVCPAGPATFSNGTTTLGTGVITLANGSCTATLTTYNLPVGANTVTATVPASGNFAAITSTAPVTITKAPVTNPTTPALSQTFTASPGTINAGATDTFTYTVPVAAGNTPPTGPVVFSSPGLATPITCTNFVAGTAVPAAGTTPAYTPYSCVSTTTLLAAGTDAITATYTATDPNYANTPALTQNVTVTAAGTGSLTANPTSTTYGSPVVLTETIGPINGVCPAGPATFKNGTTTLGTGVITLANGSCTATLTTYNLPVGNDTVTATVPASGNFTAITSTAPVTITKAPVTNPTTPALSQTFTASPAAISAGATDTFTYTVPVAAGNTPPTGPVVFSSPGLATPITCTNFVAGTAVPAAGTTPAYTPYSCVSTTTLLAAGTDAITATYTATDPNYANTPALTQNVTVNAAGTGSLTANPISTTYGSPVVLTETIAPINGVCPAGPATFKNGTTTLGTGVITLANGSCTATLTTYNLPVGANTVTATVPASGNFTAITSTAPVTITKAPVTNPTTPALSQTFTASPGTITVGATDTLTYTIPVAAGNLPPTGPVVFSSPGLTVPITCTTFVAGTTVPAAGTTPAYTNYNCVSTTTALLVGNPDVITATYTALDPNYANTPALTQNVIVNAVNTTQTVVANPNPATYGQPVTLTYTVPTTGGNPPATGTVTCTIAGQTVTGTLVNGVATIPVTGLPVGANQPANCSYPGNGTYAAGTATTPVTVNKVPASADTFIATPVTQVVGLPVNLIYTVVVPVTVPVSTPTAAPTGTVTFTGPGGYNSGPIPVGAGGIAQIPTSTLPVGNNQTLTAVYSGDANYAGTTLTTPVTITQSTGTGQTVTVNPNPSVFGNPVTIVYTVPTTTGNPPATGTVTCTVGGQTVTGTVTGGVASIPVNGLPVGSNPVSCTYSGNTIYAPGTATGTAVVNPVAPISVVTVNPPSPSCGASVTLTDTLTQVNNSPFYGTVQFYFTTAAGVTTPLGAPVAVSPAGVATLTTTALPCVAGTVTAIFTPIANPTTGAPSPYSPVTGGPVAVAAAPLDFTIAATPPNQIVNPGDTTTYTITLAGANGVPFTSPVTLTATGLPPGATVTFGTTTYVPNLGPTATTMTIVTSPTQAMLQHPGSMNGIYYGLLLLPLLGLRRIRRKIRALPKSISYCLAALILLGGLGAVTGCGGGYFGPAPKTFTITVTGTSGTLSHSTSVTLTVR